jgi:hypothetical protein
LADINPTLRLSMFSLFLALDFIIGLIPLGGIMLGWLLMPMVYVVCGKRLALAFYGIGILETLPQLLGLGVATVQTTSAVITPHSATSITVPYLTPFLQWFDEIIRNGVLELPPEVRPFPPFLMLIAVMGYWVRVSLESAKETLANVPLMISLGMVDKKYKPIFCGRCKYTTHSAKRLTRHLKRKHGVV